MKIQPLADRVLVMNAGRITGDFPIQGLTQERVLAAEKRSKGKLLYAENWVYAPTVQKEREILEKTPYIWLPTPYIYTAWWPWVKGYNGELRAGAVRPGPIYARMWVDQELKKKMGK